MPAPIGEKGIRHSGRLDVVLVAALLLAIAVLLFWWAHETEDHYWREVIFAIAHATIVVAVFSLLLDLPHITNFVVRELGKIIYGEEYLERHRPLIPQIRRTVDLVQFGQPALAHEGSLYNFIDRNIHQYYVSHYRRQYQELINLRVDGAFLVLETTSTYILVKNPSRGAPPVSPLGVPFGSTFTKTPGNDQLRDHLLDLVLKVGEVTYRLDHEAKALKAPSGGNVQNIPFTTEQDAEMTRYGFAHSLTEAELSDRGEVRIQIFERSRIPYGNDVYAMTMSLPTENFTLICNAPEDVKLTATAFGMSSGEHATQEYGHTVVTIDDWLLPGHGVALSWDVPHRGGPAPETGPRASAANPIQGVGPEELHRSSSPTPEESPERT